MKVRIGQTDSGLFWLVPETNTREYAEISQNKGTVEADLSDEVVKQLIQAYKDYDWMQDVLSEAWEA